MQFKKILLHFNSIKYSALVLFLFNLALTQISLLKTFGYEFAAANGLILVIISGLYTIKSLSDRGNQISDLIEALFILSVIPIIVIIINSILTMFCSFWDGLIFYVLIVYTSIIFGTAVAYIINLYLRRLKKTVFLLIIFLIALIPIIEIYFQPQVYFYSPLIGFFPGNIYDEGLSPDLKLLTHQIIISLFSGFIINLFFVQRNLVVKYKYVFLTSILFIVIVFQFFSPTFGYSTSFSKLENILINKMESDRLCLYYDDISKNEAQYIFLNQEYYYSEILKALNTNPSKKINVYLFNNRQQKKEVFGAGNADVAKPWQYAIYISADSWERTLKHELVHIFTAEFGVGLFKLSSGFNPALIEGVAEAIEGTNDEMSVMDVTSLAFNYNHKINLTSLFSGFNFFKSNSSLAYTYSGAFIKYLIGKYGIEKVKVFYGNGDFNESFNLNLNEVQKEFEETLKKSSFGNQAMADYYFGRLSIIQKVCPRYISDRLTIAYKKLNENKLAESESLFLEINNKSMNYSAIIGLSEVYLRENKIIKAIDLSKANIKAFNRTPYYYNLIFRIADLYSYSNNLDSASLYYQKLVNENPNYDLYYLSQTRLSLLKSNYLKEYLEGDDSTKYNLILKLNQTNYNYNTTPILLSLSKRLKNNYNSELKNFNKTFIVDNLESSYAAFKLSEYMLASGDYANGRKYAALSLRYKVNNPFYLAMNNNYDRARWLFFNAQKYLELFINN